MYDSIVMQWEDIPEVMSVWSLSDGKSVLAEAISQVKVSMS